MLSTFVHKHSSPSYHSIILYAFPVTTMCFHLLRQNGSHIIFHITEPWLVPARRHPPVALTMRLPHLHPQPSVTRDTCGKSIPPALDSVHHRCRCWSMRATPACRKNRIWTKSGHVHVAEREAAALKQYFMCSACAVAPNSGVRDGCRR